MVEILVVPWDDPRGIAMRDAMNAETGAMYAAFTEGNTPEVNAAIDAVLSVDPATIVHTVIAVDGERVLGHTALRPVSTGSTAGALEVKKVFVEPDARGTGVARALLAEAEDYARARGVTSLVLQTGPLQVDAIALYLKIGYVPIEPYGGYEVINGALCYEKTL